MARAALEFAAARPELLAAHRQLFLSIATDRVLGSREALPASSLLAYKALAGIVTDAEAADILLPAIVRLSKRSPEGVLGSAAALLGMLRLDLSSHAEALTKELVPHLRHSRDAVRRATTHLCGKA